MIEDKLNQEQRIRLECLAQANVTDHSRNAVRILETAKKFEAFIKGEDKG